MSRLLRVGRNVSDLGRLTAFYRALGFTPGAGGGAPHLSVLLGGTVTAQAMWLGAQCIELTEVQPPGAAYPAGAGAPAWFQHVAIVTTDIAAAVAGALRHGARPISRGIQHLPPEAGGVAAYKFRDPDGHPLEFLQFPPGGAWDGGTALALGYDHSAISVVDVAASVAFYDRLGLRQTARQVNQGPAQDALDGMAGVQVDVVALAPDAQPTPHLELLGYHGAVACPAWGVGDLAADRLHIETPGGGGLVRDPAGHIVVLEPVSSGRSSPGS